MPHSGVLSERAIGLLDDDQAVPLVEQACGDVASEGPERDIVLRGLCNPWQARPDAASLCTRQDVELVDKNLLEGDDAHQDAILGCSQAMHSCRGTMPSTFPNRGLQVVRPDGLGIVRGASWPAVAPTLRPTGLSARDLETVVDVTRPATWNLP